MVICLCLLIVPMMWWSTSGCTFVDGSWGASDTCWLITNQGVVPLSLVGCSAMYRHPSEKRNWNWWVVDYFSDLSRTLILHYQTLSFTAHCARPLFSFPRVFNDIMQPQNLAIKNKLRLPIKKWWQWFKLGDSMPRPWDDALPWWISWPTPGMLQILDAWASK